MLEVRDRPKKVLLKRALLDRPCSKFDCAAQTAQIFDNWPDYLTAIEKVDLAYRLDTLDLLLTVEGPPSPAILAERDRVLSRLENLFF